MITINTGYLILVAILVLLIILAFIGILKDVDDSKTEAKRLRFTIENLRSKNTKLSFLTTHFHDRVEEIIDHFGYHYKEGNGGWALDYQHLKTDAGVNNKASEQFFLESLKQQNPMITVVEEFGKALIVDLNIMNVFYNKESNELVLYYSYFYPSRLKNLEYIGQL